ncbi:MAG: MFS transporter [Chloroflexota bacterium]|nr:MFS transporter [Chloroflexota bacterium]
MQQTTKESASRVWIVVLGCCLAAVSFGSSFAFGAFLDELKSEFQLSGIAISSLPISMTIVTILLMLFGGRSVDRHGARFPLWIAVLLIGPSMALLSRADDLWHLYACFAISALGGGFVATVPTSVVQKWFSVDKRGLGLGFATAGLGLGKMIYPWLSGALIEDHGWRMAYLVLGICTTLLILIAALTIVDSPEKKGMRPYGSGRKGDASHDLSGGGGMVSWTTQEAMRSWVFRGVCLYFFLMILAGGVVDIYLISFIHEEQEIASLEDAAAVLSLAGGISIIGRIGMGMITPKFISWRQGLVICSVICGGGILWLSYSGSSMGMMWLFAIVYGLFQGARVPLIPGIIGAYYGTKSIASLIAIATTGCMLGAIVGNLLGGVFIDVQGSYSNAFLIGAISCLVGGVLATSFRQPNRIALPIEDPTPMNPSVSQS